MRNGDDLETPSAVQSLSGSMREADLSEGLGEGRRRQGRNRHMHLTTRRDHGPSILRQTCRVTSGRTITQQGLAATCKDPAFKGGSRGAGFGLAHGLV